jgi:DNA-3-methyladenine glycosylase
MPNSLENPLNAPAEKVAPRLLGCILTRTINGRKLSGRIVETEAYDQQDAASHSYKGQTPRTDVMFGAAGHLYVYFTYGMHYCCNVVTGKRGEGSAVLIRALEPLDGEDEMAVYRGIKQGIELSNGPAKLCQALQINQQLNGHDLSTAPLTLSLEPELPGSDIVQTTRVGISVAQDVPWRFYLKNNKFVSKL